MSSKPSCGQMRKAKGPDKSPVHTPGALKIQWFWAVEVRHLGLRLLPEELPHGAGAPHAQAAPLGTAALRGLMIGVRFRPSERIFSGETVNLIIFFELFRAFRS